MAFLLIASLGLSRAFACATPFVAVAVIAAATLPRRRAAALVMAVWVGNQAIGFGLSHYPHTVTTFAWGGTIGLAALSVLGAAGLARATARGPVGVAASFIAGFASYEAVLYAATTLLPSGTGAFALPVLLRILAINAAACGLLAAVHRLAGALPPVQRRARLMRNRPLSD